MRRKKKGQRERVKVKNNGLPITCFPTSYLSSRSTRGEMDGGEGEIFGGKEKKGKGKRGGGKV